MFSRWMFHVDIEGGLPMRFAITFRSQAQNKCDQNKSNDPFFFRRENETLPKRVPSRAPMRFQFFS
ncbi:MAG: hypothetical protein QOI22_115 [Verrucomicrobiota bacterium]